MPRSDRLIGRLAPSQERGVRRVEAILDAANLLLAEVGYDALTLTEVAERSGSAISSLYRFFSNKEELIDALADRVAARLRPITESVLDPSAVDLPLEAFAGRLIDRISAVAAEFPGLADLMGSVVRRNAAFDSEIAGRLNAFFALRAPSMHAPQRAAVVRMTMTIVRGGIQAIMQSRGARRALATGELKAALSAYLTARFG
jgi:AcrR family transcriptional regulator